jgi:hypothetical protein
MQVFIYCKITTYFGCLSHPSSGVHKTVTAASGTGHSIWVTTFLQRDQIRTCLWRSHWTSPNSPNLATLEKGCYPDTMTCTRDCNYSFFVLLMMGAMDTRNMYSDFAVNKYLHTVTSCWILLIYHYGVSRGLEDDFELHVGRMNYLLTFWVVSLKSTEVFVWRR